MKNIFFVFFLILLITSCNSKKNITETKPVADSNSSLVALTQGQIKNAKITFGNLETKQISSILKLNGKVDLPPQNTVSVSVPLGGYLKSTKLLPGMPIKKDEVIAVIEDQQYIQLQQDYLMAKSKIYYSQLEYERQKELNQSKASSDKVFQQSEAELNGLKITLSALSEKLKLIGVVPSSVTPDNICKSIDIKAPINGYVSKVNVNRGKYISPTDIMFELINTDDIHLALKVFEKDINKLQVGQKVMAYSNNQPDKKFACEILLIGKDISSERTTDVHCHFEDHNLRLSPGTFMNAEIQVKSNNSFVLPENAVLRFENKQYAFIKKGETQFEMTEVQTGDTENGFTEILNGERYVHESFITQGAYSLLMALKNKSDE